MPQLETSGKTAGEAIWIYKPHSLIYTELGSQSVVFFVVVVVATAVKLHAMLFCFSQGMNYTKKRHPSIALLNFPITASSFSSSSSSSPLVSLPWNGKTKPGVVAEHSPTV